MENMEQESSLAEFYNDLYKTKENVFSADARPLTKELAVYLKRGVIADIGAGEGIDAVFLATKGFEVDAYDFSKVAIDRIIHKARQSKAYVNTQLLDAKDIIFEKEYDAILSYFLLHHMENNDGYSLIEKIKKSTKVGGFNAIAAFTKESDFFKNNTKTPNLYFNSYELKSLYQNWEIISYEEKIVEAAVKNNNQKSFNTAAFLLAKKQ